MRICLAASGGGHIRQLLDLEAVWAEYDHYILTEETALGKSVALQSRTYFLPHIAWGQARMGRIFKLLVMTLLNLWKSAVTTIRERPDVVITTGAGTVYFATLIARLLGARVFVIESLARFDSPSRFGRLAAPLAHCMIVQSAKVAPFYTKARVFNPMKILDVSRGAKESLLLATIGATLPFDRMVQMVADAKEQGFIPERVVAQVGTGGIRPANLETFETLPFAQMHAMLDRADIVVCHGGTGSLITALQHGCRVIVVPRQHDLDEHYDDHQSEITAAFHMRGLVHPARTPAEFRVALEAARAAKPVHATSDPQALRKFLRRALRLVDRKLSGRADVSGGHGDTAPDPAPGASSEVDISAVPAGSPTPHRDRAQLYG